MSLERCEREVFIHPRRIMPTRKVETNNSGSQIMVNQSRYYFLILLVQVINIHGMKHEIIHYACENLCEWKKYY